MCQLFIDDILKTLKNNKSTVGVDNNDPHT